MSSLQGWIAQWLASSGSLPKVAGSNHGGAKVMGSKGICKYLPSYVESMCAFVVFGMYQLIQGIVINLMLGSSLSPVLNLVCYVWLQFFVFNLYSAVLHVSLLFACTCSPNSCGLSTTEINALFDDSICFRLFRSVQTGRHLPVWRQQRLNQLHDNARTCYTERVISSGSQHLAAIVEPRQTK